MPPGGAPSCRNGCWKAASRHREVWRSIPTWATLLLSLTCPRRSDPHFRGVLSEILGHRVLYTYRFVKPRFLETLFVCDIVVLCLTLLCHDWYVANKPTNKWCYGCRGANLFRKCFSAENPDVTTALEFRHFRSTSGSSAMCGPMPRLLEESSSHEWSMIECRREHTLTCLYEILPTCAIGCIVIAWPLQADKNCHWIPYILIIKSVFECYVQNVVRQICTGIMILCGITEACMHVDCCNWVWRWLPSSQPDRNDWVPGLSQGPRCHWGTC